VADNGHYVLEDLASRHGTWVNGERVARHILRSSDRIDLGVPESYQLTFTLEAGEINRILDQIASGSRVGGMGDNNLAKLRSLVEVARALQNSLSTHEVLTAVVDAALAVTGCERGFLLLRKGDSLDVSVARDLEGKALDAGDLRVPTAVIQRALNTRRELLSMSFNPGSQEPIEGLDRSVAALELRSAVCVPLVQVQRGSMEETRLASHAQQTVGLLYLDSRLSPADLSAGNREVLQTLAIEASTILENARLMEDQHIKLRMESELKIARDIQQGLAPVSLPTDGWYRAAGSSWASTEVGGDYFDVRRVSPDAWAAVVADVSGKGVSSALLASLLQGAFLMASGEFSEIEPMMAHLNRFLLERARGEKYATVFYCLVSAAGLLSYSNAGHCAPFLVSRDGRLRTLHTSGMPVGMLEEAQFQVVQLQLERGDKIVIYSDGLTEAENAAGEFFDTERLRACLRENASLSAADLHKVLLSTLDAFVEGGVIRDDITALVLEYT
jgi:serine phosphatase RsbU (regulator of sigma subunit)